MQVSVEQPPPRVHVHVRWRFSSGTTKLSRPSQVSTGGVLFEGDGWWEGCVCVFVCLLLFLPHKGRIRWLDGRIRHESRREGRGGGAREEGVW